jgi:hypothetical protein
MNRLPSCNLLSNRGGHDLSSSHLAVGQVGSCVLASCDFEHLSSLALLRRTMDEQIRMLVAFDHEHRLHANRILYD